MINQTVPYPSALQIIMTITKNGAISLQELRAKFCAQLRTNPEFASKSNQELEKILSDLLNTLSAHFGSQSLMLASDRDVDDTDYQNDVELQKTLAAIKSGNGHFKVSNRSQLEQMLVKIPCAFISAGTNPNDSSSKNKNPQEEHEKMRAELQIPGSAFSYIEVDGFYDGPEKSFMIILDGRLKTKTFREFIQSPDVQRLISLGRKFNQDSILFQWGAAQFYYFPDKGASWSASGVFAQRFDENKDTIKYGEGLTIFDVNRDTNLPDNYYSEIEQKDKSKLRFQLDICFDHKFNINLFEVLCLHKVATRYDHYYRPGGLIPQTLTPSLQRTLILPRGADNINEECERLRKALKNEGIHAVIVGSDAFIADLDKEGFTDFIKDVKPRMMKGNRDAVHELIRNDNATVIIFADLNKRVKEYITEFGEAAHERGIQVIAWVVSDKDPHCKMSYQLRHNKDLIDNGINDDKLTTLNMYIEIPQLHGGEQVAHLVDICKANAAPKPSFAK